MRYMVREYFAEGNRGHYEDCSLVENIWNDTLLCMIADGIGGLNHAAEAARLVVKEIHEYLSREIRYEIGNIKSLLSASMETANERILQERRRLFCKMGAAVTVLLFHKEFAYISWLGDVRVYLVQNENISLLTTDHTIQTTGNDTTIEQQRYNHVLTRCVKGSDIIDEIPFIQTKITPGDRYILCSDGFYNNTRPEHVKTHTVEQVIMGIKDQEDDYSAIEVHFLESSQS